MVHAAEIALESAGFCDLVDITAQLSDLVRASGIGSGIVTVFCPGSTGGLTTIEFEPGLQKDLPELLERIVPSDRSYHHDRTWHDGNGFAHLRSALIGPDLTVPFTAGKLALGTWQQVVFLDFDNKARRRRLAVQIIGE
ncbi:MAG TPA: secondary thiamine-phosphate synthase enzyme YjbQ [candidate division Zixibacteria bacterium]|nr:secondary thiamine-phosphate synthase enzyme YjbQ [candidate division Zixibacteria bacterium]MDD4916895.1 secondary thiamine-phosphate synthase enzyme YjbQ [candidate division Zixibacteria bacterium]MDM7972163.1 secondary thiamine-phosphate synthase enzyme YjbQ [candidate division Zixibacteria bacterium]HOD67333.1 secondary thiamine-phosphate synthase enzyme YjbQ [candidate division Zixibacteria bacterium]HOZ08427.1 secondary thiamine-phosphate synthase enzyme YjbQ [candidate division Zixiba